MPSIKPPKPSTQTRLDTLDSKHPKFHSDFGPLSLSPNMVKGRVIIDTDPVRIWALSQSILGANLV